ASIEGVVQEDGTILYEPEFAGGTIDFWANPGESQTHVVYSDANISVKPSDEVDVKMGTGDKADILIITVKHKDGTTDTYEVQKGYKANVNVNAEYITYNGVASDEIPADLAERLTVNGGTSATGENTGGVSADAVVSTLLDATGRTEAQLISALKAAGYTYDTIEDLKKAIKDKEFPPEKPDAKLVQFLGILDADLTSAVNDVVAAFNECKPDDVKKTKMEAATQRLVELLQSLYPDAIVTAEPSPDLNQWGTISFTGTEYNFTGGTDGTLNLTET
ncbi:MAG: hypothetical protein IT573_05490, partial [Deltaproteobacteria bacterium]|nr:hypothetical protein [Deltaproteobacteria bacterium]